MLITARTTALLLGAATFTALFALAGVFYLERVGHIDMAFQTFLMLKDGTLEIQHQRFGAAVTQIWPVLAQAIGCPLKAVLLAHSLGQVLWPALVFAWCCWLRQWQWATVLLLVLVGMPTHTFYFLSELPQGLAFLVGLLAWTHAQSDTMLQISSLRKPGTSLQWLLWVGAIATAFYFHPMMLYVAVFGCLFLILTAFDSALRSEGSPSTRYRQGFKNAARYLVLLAVLAFAALMKYKILPLNWYDAAALERTKAYAELWPHWWDIPSNHALLRGFAGNYWFIPFGLLLSAGFYAWKKNGLKMALVTVYPLAYALLVNVPFQESAQAFYIENLWLPFGFFAALPLVFDVLPGLRWSERFQFTVLAVVLTLGVGRIALAHRPWTTRLEWERDFLKKTADLPAKKLILTEKQVPMDTIKMSWAMPYEFLLLSSLDTPDGARCILVTEDPTRYDALLDKPHLFLGTFKNYNFEKLPARYFHLLDTSTYVLWRN